MTRSFARHRPALIAAGTLLSSARKPAFLASTCPRSCAPTMRRRRPSYGRGRHTRQRRSSGGLVKRRIAKSEPVAKSVKAAKVEKQDKPAKVAKVAKSESVKVAKAEPVEATPAETENSAITVAAADTAVKDAPVAKAEVSAKPTDCKKFFASVGMTLTVPCEQ